MINAKVYCDRCKKEITKETGGHRIFITDGFSNNTITIDLCDSCYYPLNKALIRFLKNEKLNNTTDSIDNT